MPTHAIHVLRKYDLTEWGGTESAVQRLVSGLTDQGVESVIFCPRPCNHEGISSTTNGCPIRYFNAHVPVWGLTSEERQQFVAVGGNLLSFDLFPGLWRESNAHLIHAHTLGRIGAIAGAVAHARRLPFVVTIHGGYLDLPEGLKQDFHKPPERGFDWGRAFGLLLRSRKMLEQADAILTCNPTEAGLLQHRFPSKRVQVQPHGIQTAQFQKDSRGEALATWPQLRNRRLLLCVGRIDPVKNQRWLVDQAPRIFEKYSDVAVVLAGPATDAGYCENLAQAATAAPLQGRIILTGGLPPADPRLTGLYQLAEVVILPSVSETFGLVLLEAWAAGAAVVSSRTSGASALVEHGKNGWLFDLEKPETFHDALATALDDRDARERTAKAGKAKVLAEYDLTAVAARAGELYHQLIEEKSCVT